MLQVSRVVAVGSCPLCGRDIDVVHYDTPGRKLVAWALESHLYYVHGKRSVIDGEDLTYDSFLRLLITGER